MRTLPSLARRACVIALLTVVSTVTAQNLATVELSVLPTEGKAAACVRTTVEGRWLVLQDGAPYPGRASLLKSGGSILAWQGDLGDVFTVVFIPHDVKQSIAAERVQLGGNSPPPPPPPPDPTEPAAWCIVIEDRTRRTADQALVISSAKLADYLDQHKIRRWFKDRSVKDEHDQPVPAMVKFLGYLAEHNIPLPVLLVISESGQVLYAGGLPATADDVIEILEHHR